MKLSWDPAKRDRTLAERGLDFAAAGEVCAGPKLEFPELRQAYGEERIITVGFLAARMMIVVWTARDSGRQVISMRKANERERSKFSERLGDVGRA